jgi:serine protease Do
MKFKHFVFVAILMVSGSARPFAQDVTQLHLPGLNFTAGLNQSYLGVQLRDITASEVDHLNLPREAGVFIVRVEEDSPASEAGLREGDVILQFGPLPAFSVRQFQRVVSESPAGRQLELTLMRDGQSISASITLDDRDPSPRFAFLERGSDMLGGLRDRFGTEPRRESRSSDRPRLGIRGQELTDQLGETLGVPDRKGVLIMEVTSDSPAHKAGLRAGDVIISVNHHSVASVSDVSRFLEQGSVELEIIRDKRKQEIPVEIETQRERSGRSMRL